MVVIKYLNMKLSYGIVLSAELNLVKIIKVCLIWANFAILQKMEILIIKDI